MMTGSRAKQGVLCIGSFAPPLHGVSASLERIAADLAQHAEVHRFTISPGEASRLAYHVVRSARVCVAVLGMAVYRLRGLTRLYTAADADWGAFYSCIIVGVARLLGYRVFVHHHSFAYITQRSVAMSMLVWLGGRRAKHILLCECMRDQFCSLYTPSGGHLVVSNAAHIQPGPKRMPPSAEHAKPFKIGHLSNLCYEKGFTEVVAVFETLAAEGLDVQLVLAGPAANASIQQEIDRIKLRHRDRVSYLGRVSGTDKQAFYETIDVFLFPTRYRNEAQPYVLIEAIAAGVPCLALRRGCITETLRASSNSIIDAPSEFTSVAGQAIRNWMKDPWAWQQASEEVLCSSERQFTAAQVGYNHLIHCVAGLNTEENTASLVTRLGNEQIHANT